MLKKKVLSLFHNESGLDFNLFKQLIEESKDMKEEVLELDSKNLNLLFKLLIDHSEFSILSKIVKLLSDSQTEYNPSVLFIALIKLKTFKDPDDFKKVNGLISDIEKGTSICLQPFSAILPERLQKSVETALAKRREYVEEFREDLKGEIEFLKTQHLTEKALELEEKLRFHFPEIKTEFISREVNQSKSKEQNYSKVIERNISYDSRSKDRKKISTQHAENLKKENQESLKLAKLWLSDLKSENLELLLTQLEFLDFNNPDFYAGILDQKDTDVWTQVFIFLKSKHYLEGLNFLAQNESALLTESPDSIYNFYYTKGLFFLGAGMSKEAEEIFQVIKEQKENYRDIQRLLQDVHK